MKVKYCLTDGLDIAEVREMTADEFEAAQRAADYATDGNWRWVEDCDALHKMVEFEAQS
jgi:hypothetical protein